MSWNKFYLLFFLFGAGCTSKIMIDKSTNLASINIIDQEGISETFSNVDRLKIYENVNFLHPQPYKKVLRVYHRNLDGDILACVTSYHDNGQIKQYMEIANGRAFGAYKEWYEDGTLKIEADVIGGDADITQSAEKSWLFNGCNRAWDQNGNLIAEIPYEKGQLKGCSLHFHPNGTIWKKAPFERNQVNGTYEVYLEDGQLLMTSEYVNGIKQGKTVRYWNPDKISSEEIFSKDKLITGYYYDLDGNLISEIKKGNGFRAIFGKNAIAELQEYRDGILEGEIRVFGNDNQLVKIYHLKNGLKEGCEIEYYDKMEQQPKLLVSWHDAKLQGVVKTWYYNGIQESQREMTNNKKNGLSTAWYKDGNLMMIEEYDLNKLVRGEYYKKGDKEPLSIVSNGKGLATLFDSEGNFLHKINYLNGKPDEY